MASAASAPSVLGKHPREEGKVPDAILFYGVSVKPMVLHRHLIETDKAYAKGVVAYIRADGPAMFSKYTAEDVVIDLITDGGAERSEAEETQARSDKKRRRKAPGYQCADPMGELEFVHTANGPAAKTCAGSSCPQVTIPLGAEWAKFDIASHVVGETEYSNGRRMALVGKAIHVYRNGLPTGPLPSAAALGHLKKQVAELGIVEKDANLSFHLLQTASPSS